MKRFALFIFVLILTSLPVMAQNASDVITLNDATPAIDAVITLPANTTGTIALDFSGAAVTLTDADGNVVFSAEDARLHGLELNLVPNSGSHTLTVKRLGGVTAATVRVTSLPELTQKGTPELVSGLMVEFNQEISLPLSADHPGDTVSIKIPETQVGVITAAFPGANATTQLIDAAGKIVAASVGAHIDGLNLVLDAGDYSFTLLANELSGEIVAGVRVHSVDDAGFVVMPTPETTADVEGQACTAVITVSSVNLRSGPGTGYSVLGYGYRNQTFTVGGHHPEDSWLLVGTDAGSAWVARSGVTTQGSCADLTVFNIPLRDAQPAPIIITSPSNNDSGGSFNNQNNGEHEDDDDHEEEEDDDHD